jgi:hypothetical protein
MAFCSRALAHHHNPKRQRGKWKGENLSDSRACAVWLAGLRLLLKVLEASW